ncbi:MAG TPA: hypothetical protein PLD25_25035 [Chloroflexota bacterium]|nr:hypothetical protein [Chloroflexota bacterium]
MLMQKRIAYMMVGGLLALTLAFGGLVAFAQTDDGDAEPTETPTQEEDTAVQTAPTMPGGFGSGHGRPGFGGKGMDEEALAAALGITVEELEAAQTAVRAAQIEQAVADGLLTQEQADQLAQGGGGFHLRGGLMVGDQGEALAEALGITVEELQAAQAQVRADELAALVAAGTITQEQADLMLARQAVQNYVDQDALQAAVQSVYETAVAEALSAGAITQAQADALLSNLGDGFGGLGIGGHGHHGHR